MNGQFTGVTFKIQPGAFVDNMDAFIDTMNKVTKPSIIMDKLVAFK